MSCMGRLAASFIRCPLLDYRKPPGESGFAAAEYRPIGAIVTARQR
jgi:hypothetical protein